MISMHSHPSGEIRKSSLVVKVQTNSPLVWYLSTGSLLRSQLGHAISEFLFINIYILRADRS